MSIEIITDERKYDSRRMEFSLRFNQPESNHLLIKYKLLLYNILQIKNRFFNLRHIKSPASVAGPNKKRK